VADPRSAVTDTHPLLIHAAGQGAKLGRRARAIFEACEHREAILYVPLAVVWECTLLARRGRVDLGGRARDFFGALFSNPAYQLLEVDAEQVFLADDMQPNEDPFDALICAAARSVELPLVTRDDAIVRSGIVKVLW
jgi:PIN domain nuclease of toxin-antitoxin system